MPLGTSYIIKTIRLHVAEDAIFNSACDALGGLERAQLMQEAVLFECSRLGVRFSAEPPPPLRKPWPYLPERGDGATGVRISISLRVTVAELMSIAAARRRQRDPVHRGRDARVRGAAAELLPRDAAELAGGGQGGAGCAAADQAAGAIPISRVVRGSATITG